MMVEYTVQAQSSFKNILGSLPSIFLVSFLIVSLRNIACTMDIVQWYILGEVTVFWLRIFRNFPVV